MQQPLLGLGLCKSTVISPLDLTSVSYNKNGALAEYFFFFRKENYDILSTQEGRKGTKCHKTHVSILIQDLGLKVAHST